VSRRSIVAQDIAPGAVAGALAAVAYLGAMAVDMALTHYPSSALQVIAGSGLAESLPVLHRLASARR
jgi:hypothetical protein